MVTSEVAVYLHMLQVGGMADVVTALSRAVKDAGHQVKVIVPKYDVINYAQVDSLLSETAYLL